MKRDKRLHPLSWEHQHGLALGREIKLSLTSGAPEAVSQCLVRLKRAWEYELGPHFLNEETLLFPRVRPGNKPCHIEIEKALGDHSQMRSLVKIMASATQLDVLGKALFEFAECLIGHIRFEEEVLFPLLEKSLDPEDFDVIGRELLAEWQRNHPG
jgi:iron-sulfur cluster repair protein YtfE (RIC family)